jgi:hypothetical protein
VSDSSADESDLKPTPTRAAAPTPVSVVEALMLDVAVGEPDAVMDDDAVCKGRLRRRCGAWWDAHDSATNTRKTGTSCSRRCPHSHALFRKRVPFDEKMS